MKRKWKPGDVALVCQSGHDRLALRNPDEWLDECGDAWDDSAVEMWGRPIVVIDPEDHQQVERLVKALSTGQPLIGLDPTNREMVDQAWVTHTQTALREFANPTPPKPEEPMAFASAVEDRDEIWWTRTGTGPRCGKWCNADGDRVDYADIDVVRVISEGVTA